MVSYECTKDPEKVIKRALFKAWKACGQPLGMGVLQDKPDAAEEDVWNNVQTAGDYPGGPVNNEPNFVNADYVFGRMMKLMLEYEEDVIRYPEGDLSPGYQAWCEKYPSYRDLLEAAESEVE